MVRLARLRAALGVAFAGLLVAGGAATAGGNGVKVLRSIPFAESSGASQKLKEECQLETRVPQFLSQYADGIELVDGELGSAGRVLKLRISHVRATGGGAFSGPKTVTVEGRLSENGKPLGSFTATRYSGGGVFGGYKGTCSIVARCAKAIGKDIAEWLRNPKDGARLGDA
jgi:hypothetical protein